VALTVKRIARYLSTPGRYADGGGLYLQVPQAGEKMPREQRGSWLLRYERGGKEHWHGLGAIRDYTLDEARERARELRRQLKEGVDPVQAAKAKRAQHALDAARSKTFEQAAREYFDDHETKWRNAKHRNQFLSSLAAFAFPKIGALPVASIDIGLVLQVLEQKHKDYPEKKLWDAIPVTMSRVRARIESVLDWAKIRGFRTGDNPAKWKNNLSEVLAPPRVIAKVAHHPALKYADMPAFLAELRKHDGVAPMAVEFTILTAARTGEVTGARWDEIDFKNAMWTVPASRMKAKREHRVPLSDRTIKILRALPRDDGNPFVFIGSKGSLGNSAMIDVLRRGMGRSDITVHGFRSTFRDWAAERTNYPREVCELALAHIVGSQTERAYERGDAFDKRRTLMDAWAKFCATPPPKATGDKVVSMRGKR
jgi:integrase